MQFKEFGDKSSKTIILLHGGGLSWWSFKDVAVLLENGYHVVAPIIDGHGEDGNTNFISIEDSAKKLIEYIDSDCGAKVFALAGLSIGAQIVTDVLSQKSDIAEFAIIESALVIPIKGAAAMAKTNNLLFGLIKQRWFSKMQAKSLALPNELFELYYNDSVKMSKQSLINITLSNGNYKIKDSLSKTQAQVLIIVGEKEIGMMRKSAEMLHSSIQNNRLYVAPKMKHGEMSLLYPQKYVECLKSLFKD